MKVLFFAPHRDDEIIGCGGTLLKRKEAGDYVAVCVVTAREGDVLPPETQRIHNEMIKAHEYCKIDEYVGLPFGANKLEEVSRVAFNKAFSDVIERIKPDEVYIPFWGDMQKDHRLTTDAAMVAMRAKLHHAPKRIYAYETLSETGIGIPDPSNAFIPNVYEDISMYLDKKIKAMSFYESQLHEFPDLRSADTIISLAKFRGAMANVSAAEAFMLVREIKD